MAGHSKWANIKYRKSVVDARKGKIFTKLARELQAAARQGGPDPEANLRLRLVLDKARAANMPKENIERAIARGAGLEKGEELEEVMYEAYAPHGVALLLEVLTDNRNRTVSEIRHLITRAGGNMAGAGAVIWQFDRKGQIVLESNGADPDAIFLTAIDAGAEDVTINEDGTIAVITAPDELGEVRDRLSRAGYAIASAEITMVPQNEIELPPEEAMQVFNLLERLEELDDVQKVHSNLALSDELWRQLEPA